MRPHRFARWLHVFFRLGVVVKGIDALLEIAGAALVLYAPPGTIRTVVYLLTQHELSEDPHDLLATHLRSAAQQFSLGDRNFAAVYLLLHGVLKVGLVWGLLKGRLSVYPVAIVVFVGFAVYQMYRYLLSHSVAMIGLTLLDVVVILLTLFEYRRLRGAIGTRAI